MREDIATIPVNDIFGPKDGCPFCRMRDMLEQRMAEYITGAAMMEPSVRVETNRLGFCHEHFNQMLAVGHKLSVNLILESLLDTVKAEIFGMEKKSAKKIAAAVQARRDSCFICDNIADSTRHLLEVCLRMWRTDPDFRRLYNEQPYICLPHYGQVMDAAQKLPKKDFAAFEQETTRLAAQYLDEVKGDVTHFCSMFDYRNAGGDWGNSKDAAERAIQWLTARKPTAEEDSNAKNR